MLPTVYLSFFWVCTHLVDFDLLVCLWDGLRGENQGYQPAKTQVRLVCKQIQINHFQFPGKPPPRKTNHDNSNRCELLEMFCRDSRKSDWWDKTRTDQSLTAFPEVLWLDFADSIPQLFAGVSCTCSTLGFCMWPMVPRCYLVALKCLAANEREKKEAKTVCVKLKLATDRRAEI